MFKSLRAVVLAAAFAAILCGQDDITIPLDDGNILVRAQFIRVSETGHYVPELAFTIKNQTSSWWRTIKLQFDIGGLCNGEPRQWTLVATTSLGWSEDRQVVNDYKDLIYPLFGEVEGCKTGIIKAQLLVAENPKIRIDGVSGERIDFDKQLRELKAKHDAEEAVQDRTDQEARENAAKKAAADATKRKRQAAERKRKDAEEQIHLDQAKTQEAARVAEEQAKIRAACRVIYDKTADKKVGDLTVREAQQVQSCQLLGLYPPR